MAKLRKKVILTKDFFALQALANVVYVTEVLVGTKWKQVNGTFNDLDSANAFALQYSTDHPTDSVRVVSLG